jgi:hypothetical protein
VRAVSDTAISYQWQRNGVNLSNNSHISGANSATLVLNPAQTNDTGRYSCILTNINGMTLSTTDSVLVVNGDIGWTWSAPVPITNLTADQILMIDGQIVGAATSGGTNAITIALPKGTNIVFTADGSVASVVGLGRAAAGGAGFRLTAEMRYVVQFFGLDDRGADIGARQAYYQDPIVPTDVSATFLMRDNVCVVGTITATSNS